jgi:5-methylcytosine-specific restriction protein A
MVGIGGVIMANSRKLSPCKKIGCPELSIDTYCEEHDKQLRKEQDSKRLSASERGYDSKWRKARLGYLNKHPLCVHCLDRGKYTPATVLDHITPHKGDKELFWDKKNWQSLCKYHHDVKTASEDGGFGNKIK